MSRLFELEHVLSPKGWLSPGWLRLDERGRVLELGSAPLERPAAAERVQGFVLPGMPNLHSHGFQRAMVGLAERATGSPDSFWTWRREMYRLVERLGPEDVEAISAQVYVEMLKAGYTSVGEFHYLHHDPTGRPYADRAELSLRVAAAAEHAGIGLTLLPALYTASDFGGAPPTPAQRRFVQDAENLVALVHELAQRFSGQALARVGVALHSLRAVPPGAMRACLAGIDADWPVHIHVAEQQKEVRASVDWSGARPVEWLLAEAPVGPRWCTVHATHISDQELAGLAATGAVVGLCPTTEANLGDGVFPTRKWLASNGRLGVGSDSQVGVSPAEELCYLEYQARLAAGARNVLAGPTEPSTGAHLYASALEGGAQALGLRAGLVPGARADLVVLDAAHPLLAGRSVDRVLDTWVFAGKKELVLHVMAGGRWVVRDRHHVREPSVIAQFQRAIQRLSSD